MLRGKGTEAPYSGQYYKLMPTSGMFVCRACGNQLFAPGMKYHSEASGLRGWPSFDQALPGGVITEEDASHGMSRTEVVCARCHSHLGHLFTDGPTPTGQRYCMNSVCLDVEPKESELK